MALPLRDNAPTYAVPGVTLTLIGINLAVFAWQLAYPGGFEESYAVWGEVPARIMQGQPVPGTALPSSITVLTSMFMHASWDHILGNMYALWLFGDNVEWVMGRARYLLFYLVCGLLASVATILLGQASTAPGLGASGAIAGVLAAYLMMYPRARITSLVWISPYSLMHAATGEVGFALRNISAFWYIGAWVLWQLTMSGIAIYGQVWLNLGIYAHVAGALAGAALVYPLALPRRIPAPDSDVRSAELTSPIFGDEGDAGMGTEPVASISAELARIHGEYRGQGAPAELFQDFIAEELIQKHDYAQALRHCRDMLQIAREDNDTERIQGYLALIDSINDFVPGEEDAPPPTPLQQALGGGLPGKYRGLD